MLEGKVLITGSNGLLGQKLVKLFVVEYPVIALAKDDKSVIEDVEHEYVKGNILDTDRLENVFKDNQISAVVNAAAYTDVDGCEDNRKTAWNVNVKGVENLVDLCARYNAHLVTVSTDYIFDGKNGPYHEDAPVNPLGYYGLTKLESEKIVIERGDSFPWTIVRTNVVYGYGKKVKTNFVFWVINKLRNGEKIRIVTDQYGNPTLADNLAEAIFEMVKRQVTGIYHISGSEYLNRYEFAIKIANHFQLGDPKEFISAITTEEFKQIAKRPLKGGLKIDKAQRDLEVKLLNVTEGLELMKNQMP